MVAAVSVTSWAAKTLLTGNWPSCSSSCRASTSAWSSFPTARCAHHACGSNAAHPAALQSAGRSLRHALFLGRRLEGSPRAGARLPRCLRNLGSDGRLVEVGRPDRLTPTLRGPRRRHSAPRPASIGWYRSAGGIQWPDRPKNRRLWAHLALWGRTRVGDDQLEPLFGTHPLQRAVSAHQPHSSRLRRIGKRAGHGRHSRSARQARHYRQWPGHAAEPGFY